jgi:hypothetical protein
VRFAAARVSLTKASRAPVLSAYARRCTWRFISGSRGVGSVGTRIVTGLPLGLPNFSLTEASRAPALEAGWSSSAVKGVLVPCGPSWSRRSPVVTDLGGICAAAGVTEGGLVCRFAVYASASTRGRSMPRASSPALA